MAGAGERDKSIERLLRQSQSLRAPGGAPGTESCLDAETLAAWADGGLTGAPLEKAESHVAACGRCQALLGTFARVDSTPSSIESEHSGRGWLTWLVPLTAAAVAAAVWVAVPSNPTERLQAPADVQQNSEISPGTPTSPAGRLPEQAIGANDERPSGAAIPGSTAKGEVTGELRRDQAAASPAEADSVSQQAAPAARAAAAVPPASANMPDSGAAALRAESAVAGFEIISPDPMVRWRIAGSSVQRSRDGGAAWEATPAGTTTPLTAGAAPSASVCWIVGRGGVVIVSVDGRTWRRVPFPDATDLSGVRARDARTASVTAADGRVFSTGDAGMTWVPGPLQDF